MCFELNLRLREMFLSVLQNRKFLNPPELWKEKLKACDQEDQTTADEEGPTWMRPERSFTIDVSGMDPVATGGSWQSGQREGVSRQGDIRIQSSEEQERASHQSRYTSS